MKTLAIRLDDSLHARLTIVAKLAEVSVTDAIRQSIESYVQTMLGNPAIQAKADALRQEIDREAREQQGAISQLFGAHSSKPTARKQQT